LTLVDVETSLPSLRPLRFGVIAIRDVRTNL
jgi:hypothetical protein